IVGILVNLLSITTPPLAILIQRPVYELEALFQIMQRIRNEGLVDGFEFQNLAEWDVAGPPLDKAKFEVRIKNWKICEKHDVDELTDKLKQLKLPILSVHANRDVGICLCSSKRREITRGHQLIHDSLRLTREVNAEVCVFHLWDTWSKRFDPLQLKHTLDSFADEFSEVKAAVENIPISLDNMTPFEVVKEFEWITLDLRWAGMYNELHKFASVKHRIVNVHLRGRLETNHWVIHHSPFTLSDALELIRNEWKYHGLLTIEPEGGLKNAKWKNFATALKEIR
ncbi:MAG: hypothetical protein ACFE9D_08395, partial [Promethearchaeota archaeon]